MAYMISKMGWQKAKTRPRYRTIIAIFKPTTWTTDGHIFSTTIFTWQIANKMDWYIWKKIFSSFFHMSWEVIKSIREGCQKDKKMLHILQHANIVATYTRWVDGKSKTCFFLYKPDFYTSFIKNIRQFVYVRYIFFSWITSGTYTKYLRRHI